MQFISFFGKLYIYIFFCISLIVYKLFGQSSIRGEGLYREKNIYLYNNAINNWFKSV